MKIPADINYTEELLQDAMERLDDMRLNMSMFEHDRYWRLRKHFDQHETIHKELRKALNGIDTVQQDEEDLCCG